MPLTRYTYKNAVSGFYEMLTETARKILPSHLQPLEVQHGSAVLAVTAFDFTESMVGPYQELVLAIIVPPLVREGGEFPKSAQFPFLLGTSTPESRAHAIKRWHLPHYMRDISLDFDEGDGKVDIRCHEDDRPILELTVTDHDWSEVNHLHQSFMIDGKNRFKVDIHMQGSFCEHEEERGTLILHDHAMCEQLLNAEVASYPFRELRMKNGVQVFQELERLQA